MEDFDLNDALKRFLSDPATLPTPEADSRLADCESEPELLTSGVINAVLNTIVDAIAGNPESLAHPSNFDSIQFLLK